MGLEVTATHVIWAFAATALLGGAMGAFFDTAPDLVEASEQRDELQRARLATRLGSATFCYDPALERANMTIVNMGEVRLTPSTATMLVDGIVQDATASVRGASGSDLWSPQEIAYFTADGLAAEPDRMMLVTAHGVTYAALKIPCRYLASIVISPTSATLQAGDTQDFTATGYDQHGDVFEEPSFAWTTDAGSITSLTDKVGRLSATTAGSNLNVTASYGIVSQTVTVTVMPGAPASIAVSPDPAQVSAGATQTFTATVYDAYGNVNATAPVAWTTDAGSIDASGTLTAQTLAATGKTVTATSGTASGTASVSIVAAAPASITVSPGTAGVAAGGQQTFVATAYDAYGNVNGTAPIAWTTNAGAIDANGVLTAQTTPEMGKSVTATSGAASGSATVDVYPAAPSTATVTPSSVTLSAADTHQFTATLRDAYGNVNTTAPITWTTDAGSITADGLLTAQTLAETGKSVTATSGAATGSASVTIIAAAPASITVTPDPAAVTAGATQQFAATVYDAYGNVNGTSTVSWATDAGTISSSGLLTAQTLAETGKSVTATSGSASDTASVSIVAGPVASVWLSPTTATVNTTLTQQFAATGYDQYGNLVSNATFSWTAARGAVSGAGLYTAPATVGADNVTATSNGQSASATVSVIRTVHVASIQTYKDGVATTSFARGDTVETRVTLVDHNGLVVSGASVSIRIAEPDGSVRVSNGTATTNAEGVSSYSYKLPRANIPGDWSVTVIDAYGDDLVYSQAANVVTAITFRVG